MGESKRGKRKDKKKKDRSAWFIQEGVEFNTSRNDKEVLLQQLRAIILSTDWTLMVSV